MAVDVTTNGPRILEQLLEKSMITPRTPGVTLASGISSDLISFAANVASQRTTGGPSNFPLAANTEKRYCEYGIKSAIVTEVLLTFKEFTVGGFFDCTLHAMEDAR